jgi:amino acid transporter
MTQREGLTDVHIGRTRRIGTLSLVSFLISASAPMTVLAGGVVATFAVTGVVGVPVAFPLIALALALFTVGYAAMSRHIFNAGAFYAYLAQGLGRVWAVSGAGVALLAYNTIQIGLYGLFGVAAAGFAAAEWNLTWDWWVWAMIAWAVVGLCGMLRVDFNAAVLSVLLIGEVIAVLLFDFAAFSEPAGGSISTNGLWPGELFVPGLGGVLAFTIAAFVGFESGGAYAQDVKDPRRTVARATYITLAIIGVLYTISAWALTVALGPENVVAATRDPEAGVPFATLAIFYNDGVATLANVLLITSVFAALLSFHNTTARYTYALGLEGVLPRFLGKAGRSSGAPVAGSLLQSLLAVIVIAVFKLLDRNPLTELFTWFSYIAAAALLVLMIGVSVAVIGFFQGRESAETAWQRVVAPALATVALLAIFVVLVVNADSVLGAEAGSVLTYVLPGLVPLVAILFALWGVALRATAPQVYRGIGGAGEPEVQEGAWHGPPHPHHQQSQQSRDSAPLF